VLGDEMLANPPQRNVVRTRSESIVDTGRRLAEHEGEQEEALDQLTELRNSRTKVDGGPLASRCRSSLSLAMGLMYAGRCDDALLDALDALARGREANDPEAVAACTAALAKLFDLVGSRDSAAALREAALRR
jgi:hypothetical protein